MALWQIKYTAQARKTLNKLDRTIKDRIEKYMNELCEMPNPKIKGKGLTSSRVGQWRYRVGDFRVICEIHGDIFVVLVLEIGHRSNVYK
ncbi:MAG: type II toxin-antitoxin system RelE/ParE family toxin [Synergistaceae bacterium]|nr:type II toxin-antitoxin system RelE/ParE family toxin [Synergistaceae bacterium]